MSMKTNINTTFKKQMQEIMTTAWEICRVTGESFADCLHRSWQCYKLRSAMMTRIVRFTYIKKTTGELRNALGTLDPHRYHYEAVGGRDYKPADCIRYWDTEAQGFRMFKNFNLVNVEL